jgi:hypothetical protein
LHGTGGIVGTFEGLGRTLIDLNVDSGNVSGQYNVGGILGGIGGMPYSDGIIIINNTVTRDVRIQAHSSGAAGILGGMWVANPDDPEYAGILNVTVENNLVGAEMIMAQKNAHRVFGGFFDSNIGAHDAAVQPSGTVNFIDNSALDEETMLTGQSVDASGSGVQTLNRSFVDSSVPDYGGIMREWNGDAMRICGDNAALTNWLRCDVDKQALCLSPNADIDNATVYSDYSGYMTEDGYSVQDSVHRLNTAGLLDSNVSNIKIYFKSPMAGIPAEGIVFKLIDDKNNVAGTYKTGESGELIICAIKSGHYRLEPVMPTIPGWLPHERYIVEVGLAGRVSVDGRGDVAAINQDPSADMVTWNSLNAKVKTCAMSGMSIIPA